MSGWLCKCFSFFQWWKQFDSWHWTRTQAGSMVETEKGKKLCLCNTPAKNSAEWSPCLKSANLRTSGTYEPVEHTVWSTVALNHRIFIYCRITSCWITFHLICMLSDQFQCWEQINKFNKDLVTTPDFSFALLHIIVWIL